jgi:hypothetical protein
LAKELFKFFPDDEHFPSIMKQKPGTRVFGSHSPKFLFPNMEILAGFFQGQRKPLVQWQLLALFFHDQFPPKISFLRVAGQEWQE